MQDEEIIGLYIARFESAIIETSGKYGGYCNSIAMNILHDCSDSGEEQYNDNSNIVDQSLVARVEEDGFFELDNIESVIIDGVEYRYAE